MSHPSKRKGDTAELEVARLLADRTGWPVRRRLGAGRADDCGDLDGIPDSCVQVKNYRDITRSIRETLDELPTQQTNAGTPYAFGLIRRPGGRWFAVLDLDNLCALLREAVEDPELDPPIRMPVRGRGSLDDILASIPHPPTGRGSFTANNHPTRRALRKRAGIE